MLLAVKIKYLMHQSTANIFKKKLDFDLSCILFCWTIDLGFFFYSSSLVPSYYYLPGDTNIALCEA